MQDLRHKPSSLSLCKSAFTALFSLFLAFSSCVLSLAETREAVLRGLMCLPETLLWCKLLKKFWTTSIPYSFTETLPLRCQRKPLDHHCIGKGYPNLLPLLWSEALLTCQERGFGRRKWGSRFILHPPWSEFCVKMVLFSVSKGDGRGEHSQALELVRDHGKTAKWSLAQHWPGLLALSQTIPRYGRKKFGCSHSTLMRWRV